MLLRYGGGCEASGFFVLFVVGGVVRGDTFDCLVVEGAFSAFAAGEVRSYKSKDVGNLMRDYACVRSDFCEEGRENAVFTPNLSPCVSVRNVAHIICGLTSKVGSRVNGMGAVRDDDRWREGGLGAQDCERFTVIFRVLDVLGG